MGKLGDKFADDNDGDAELRRGDAIQGDSARANFLAQDRMHIAFATKEVTRSPPMMTGTHSSDTPER